MYANVTPIILTKEKIDKVALAKWGILGRILISSSYIDSYIEYVPTYIYRYSYQGERISLLRGKYTRQGEILIIADSQSMKIGVIEQQIAIVNIQVSENSILEKDKTFDEAKTLERAKRLARKALVVKFRISPQLDYLGRETIFRPRWVSVYGKHGKETHKLITPADGFKYIR